MGCTVNNSGIKRSGGICSSKPLPRGDKASVIHQQQNHSSQYHHHRYNGLKSFDEICCATGISSQQLESNLSRDKHVIVLLK